MVLKIYSFHKCIFIICSWIPPSIRNNLFCYFWMFQQNDSEKCISTWFNIWRLHEKWDFVARLPNKFNLSCIYTTTFFTQVGRGHWAVYYSSPQSFTIMFYLSFALQLWELLLTFDWLVHLVECPNVSTTNNTKVVILCDIIVQQFISHCLIPLDPCTFILWLSTKF